MRPNRSLMRMKKSLMENFIFCAVTHLQIYQKSLDHKSNWDTK